jgi:hypothetical protein
VSTSRKLKQEFVFPSFHLQTRRYFLSACSALEQSIPNLRVFLGGEDNLECSVGDSQVLHRGWKFLLSNLIFAISRQAHPIALMFEDLQWADEDALGRFYSIKS